MIQWINKTMSRTGLSKKAYRPDVNDVFIPRSSKVNTEIYVPRPSLEKELLDAVNGSLHNVLFGDSGNGKSWLFKKTFKDNNINYVEINCAKIDRNKTVTDAILQSNNINISIPSKEGTNAKVGSKAVGITSTQQNNIEIDRLALAFKKIRKKHRFSRGKIILVLENLEVICLNKILMNELGKILILLDDESFAKYNIKFLLVGLQMNLREYYSRIDNLRTVANRIHELPEVRSLDSNQVDRLVEKGFQELLNANLDNATLKSWQSHINSVTLGFAQKVQEFCNLLALKLKRNDWVPYPEILEDTNKAWLGNSLTEIYNTIQSQMNKTKKGKRRNQVLFCVGQMQNRYFKSSEVESILRKTFPNSTYGRKNIGIQNILTELSRQGNKSIIKKLKDTGQYTIVDPKYIMALRTMLDLDGEEIHLNQRNNS